MPASLRAGHMFMLPPGVTLLNHDKPRPFTLSTECTPSTLGTMVYGSTRSTEAVFSAASITVPPIGRGLNANGLRDDTFFFPGILYPVEHAQVRSFLGYLGSRLPGLREGIRDALGIGTGTCLTPGAPAGSRRGRLVRLRDSVANDLRTPIALILTEHVYSRENRYQVLVPVLRGDALRSTAGAPLFRDKEWMSVFDLPTTLAVLPVQLVQSGWAATTISRETAFVIDAGSLREIETALCLRFGLPLNPAQ